MINVIVIDCSAGPSVRDSFLGAAPGISVLSETSTQENGLSLIETQKPDILLLGISTFKNDTRCFLQDLAEISPTTKVILLVDQLDPELLLACLEAGARGYIQRSHLAGLLVKAIRLVDQGEAWVSREMVGRILDRLVERQSSISA